ncbi:MAG TPA: hypothetical protein VD864_10015 [Nocardioides sp.]|nr:hypothetical protein [Nocardioides sp.]
MWGLWPDDPPRDALLGTAALVAGALVFTERFELLLPAVAAYAGAGWVFWLERDAGHRRERPRHR